MFLFLRPARTPMRASLDSVVKASRLKIEMTAIFQLPLHVKFWKSGYKSITQAVFLDRDKSWL